jgi:hypothetical protein
MGARAVALVFVVASFAGGCNSPHEVSLDDFGDQLTLAECAVQVRCHIFSDVPLCQRVYATGRIGSDIFPLGWMEGLAPQFSLPTFNGVAATVMAARAGKARFDAAAAKVCLDAVAAIACNDIANAPATLNDACQPVFTGTLADGERCISDLECGAHSLCAQATSDCAGTCTPAVPACNFDRQCLSGQLCDLEMQLTGGNGTCATAILPGAAGQPCGTGERCQPDLTCISSACTPLPKAGEPCGTGNPFFACASGLVCAHPDTGGPTCMEPAARGASCQVRDQCAAMFSSLVCDAGAGRCVDWATGGSCTDGCPYTAYCDPSAGTCKPDTPAGQICDDNSGECGVLGAECTYVAGSAPNMGVCSTGLAPACPP